MSQETDSQGGKPRRSFSDEFKRDAVNLVVLEGYSVKRAAKAVVVYPSSLRRWCKQLAPEPEACGEDATLQQVLEENRRLRRELREAELEREILKKATAYFAKESQ